MLSNYNRIYFDEENKFVVSFTPKEWDEISKFISAKTRAYFLIPFCDKLSLKFQEHGIKCWLKVVYNWFKPDTSQKRNSPYWSGKYICIKKYLFKYLFIYLCFYANFFLYKYIFLSKYL